MNSGNMLSQDEIDALLSGGSVTSDDDPIIEDFLNSMEQDALGEVGNISFGSASTALSTLLNQKVQITTPTVSVIKKEELQGEFPIPHVAVKVEYVEGIQGTNLLVIKTTDAQIIADLMLGGDGTSPSADFGEMQLSAVGEAMNQMMGSASTSLSSIFNKRVDISPPVIDVLDFNDSSDMIADQDILIKVSFRLKVGELIDSRIMQLMQTDFSQNLVSELMAPPMEQAAATYEDQLQSEITAVKEPLVLDDIPSNAARPQSLEPDTAVSVQPAVFSDFEESSGVYQETKNLDMLLDIPLQVTVELGRTKKSIKEILELSPGSILELDKLAGEPVDILVNERLIAKGEVVVIDENFGVRVTEIVSRKDRLKNI
ncbi:flagellar motor switch phosphatase FliY [Fictibacillus enclensis]|uniref:flagellar motor switch phosphatase FliY n=1 Tax=Fictibacillus enclensis TaxID=1017270 RepID=UPI00259FED97|nr:flagellar motor switch phosphatase FliY [Fictibacillus enclensis]MDM5198878.1 flagellar motor switch phosphatase FliY [Fictibacillus enclensis]